jgi:ribonuclease BN (tRNA processing enzyme)
VQNGDAAVLLDCGNGVLSNLGRIIDPTHLSAVFVTHGHIDHFADLYALQAALRYAPDGPRPPLPLFVPKGLFERMGRILTPHGAQEFGAAFEVTELEADRAITVGDMTITPREVDHIPYTFALVVEADGARLCYTSDSAPGAALSAAAAGAQVLLAEATLPPQYEGHAPHMTPGQAGELAREAGARTLVLTHLWPTVDREQAAALARERFDGRVIVASEMDAIDVE